MGAAASRQEDTARVAARREHMKRCRERRRLMREAVRLRRHLAASHAAYLRSLTHAASALTRFAVGEPLPVSDHAPPAVIVHRPVVAPSTPPPLLRSIEQQRRAQEDGAVDDHLVGGAGAPSVTREEGGGEELRMVVRHRSLAEVAAGLDEYFLKASVAGDDVSSLLEASNAGFKRGPNSILGALCCLSAPSVAHDRVDSINGGQMQSSTLQQLLAWEKKLYREVKAKERLQVQHDKKLAELRDQEYSRKIDVDVLKLKAAWDKASVQLATASQAMNASSAAIAELRDTHLARQLLGLCHATRDMWRVMRQHHEAQGLIAQQLRGLSSRTSMEPTTEIHHETTRALEAAMSSWCGALGHLAKHQRDYVHALHGWLRLTLQAPADGAEAASPVAAELAAFVERWGQALDRVHCADVLKSIKGFAGAVRSLHGLQSDELRVARRVSQYSREIDRKSRMLRQVEKSYYDSYVPVGLSLWHRGMRHWGDDGMRARDAHDEVAQRRDEIAACRRMVEDEMRKHAKAIDATRSAAVTGVQGKLPAVFQSMAVFSASLAHALEAVCRQGTHV
ncbi:hypothetical protein E2562_019247 [Oryza meyeriana var. granulata]|uniref:DUF632 domain-containing protein n=1 Tax=Oryza meyeriana var. granulata TaxID=110450 RepID=A0A6G1FA40_9ORYZ|nr:hypothetical protein E2562_019247 [Oryza meyeriana var. granulata]